MSHSSYVDYNLSKKKQLVPIALCNSLKNILLHVCSTVGFNALGHQKCKHHCC